jgi:hypothetical protein
LKALDPPFERFYYIVESEILRNTQWHIFHIFTSEDIEHVIFSIYTIFRLGLYNKQNITRWLEDMTFIFSCYKKQYFTHSLRSFGVKYCFHHSKIKSHIFSPPWNILYILWGFQWWHLFKKGGGVNTRRDIYIRKI